MDILNTKIKQILTEKTTKIKPENIKSGINILGVQGSSKVLDTTDANAVSNDIVTGKTAYVNGQKLTGTYTGIIPSGSVNITQNGITDVSQYASANVNVPTPTPNLQSKSITITENQTQTIIADTGYDGLDEVEITTNVSGGGGDITHEEYLEDVELARSILEDFVPYIELQHIESTGTQYFDTGYYPNQNTKVEMIVETLNLTSTFVPFGTRANSRLDYIAGINFNNQNYTQFNTNDAEYFGTSNNFLNAKLKITLYNGYFKIEYIGDDTKTVEGTFTTRDNFNCLTSLYLGCLNNNGNTRYLDQKYRIYFTKIYENNILIKDYIPAIDKFYDKVCLYDKINETFLYSSGTGNMIAGGVV